MEPMRDDAVPVEGRPNGFDVDAELISSDPNQRMVAAMRNIKVQPERVVCQCRLSVLAFDDRDRVYGLPHMPGEDYAQRTPATHRSRETSVRSLPFGCVALTHGQAFQHRGQRDQRQVDAPD